MRRACAGLVVCLLAASAADANLEQTLTNRWRGAWVVVLGEVASGCGGAYANNRVSGTLVSASARHRFAAGELARVDKVNVKRARIDLYLDLVEPILEPYQDGPFTLYRELDCRVQLMVEVPREVVSRGDTSAAEKALDDIVDRFAREEEARRSAAWNHRVRDPYPADYETTLARHAAWQKEQVNAAVDARQREASENAMAVLARLDRDAAYLDGFAAGTAALRTWSGGGCEDLLHRSFESVSKGPPHERRGGSDDDRRWRRGFEDGQRLAFALVLLHRLPGCYVPVPAVPSAS